MPIHRTAVFTKTNGTAQLYEVQYHRWREADMLESLPLNSPHEQTFAEAPYTDKKCR